MNRRMVCFLVAMITMQASCEIGKYAIYSDCDQDHDNDLSTECGGRDCDDYDSSRSGIRSEACGDGIDNDCNGIPDDNCACKPTDPAECDADDQGYLIKYPQKPPMGRCKYGQRSCNNGIWGPCSGAVGPIAETCNSIDDDCDGKVDNFRLSSGRLVKAGDACSVGTGACQNTGNYVCNNQAAIECSVRSGNPQNTPQSMQAPNGSWDWNCDGIEELFCNGYSCSSTQDGYCSDTIGGEVNFSYDQNECARFDSSSSIACPMVECGSILVNPKAFSCQYTSGLCRCRIEKLTRVLCL